MARRTPSNGLVTANQNETFKPVSWKVELVFTLSSQAFEDRHFTEREIYFGMTFLVRSMRESKALLSEQPAPRHTPRSRKSVG